MTVVVGATQMDRCGKVGKAQLLPACIANAERFQAAAHVVAVDLLLVGQRWAARIPLGLKCCRGQMACAGMAPARTAGNIVINCSSRLIVERW